MAALNAGTPASTIFVGNLAYELTEQQLIDYFSQVGPVKNIRIVSDRETGKPRGFGFIEFYDIPTAESAIRNLNSSELMGRSMRIVFAEGGPPGSSDFRPRRDDDRGFDDRGRRPPPPPRTRMVGADLSYHASHGMAALLGQPAQPGAPADAITSALARKTRTELWDYLAQMKALVQQNPQQARQILVQNPQLTKALFQMEIVLGLVANPLGDVAPKGVAPPDMLGGPRGGFAGGGGPQPGGLPPQQQQPQQAQQPLPVVGLVEQPGLMQPQPGLMPQQAPMQFLQPQQLAGQPMMPMAPAQLQGQPMMPMGSAQPQMQGQPMMAMGSAQPLQQPYQQLPQPVAAYAPVAPQQAGPAPVDPRMGGCPADPRARPQQPAQGTAPMPQQQGAALQVPGQGQAMTAEMQQALLQQVMSLTPQQIELLPPQQKAQVLALQQQLRGQGAL